MRYRPFLRHVKHGLGLQGASPWGGTARDATSQPSHGQPGLRPGRRCDADDDAAPLQRAGPAVVHIGWKSRPPGAGFAGAGYALSI